MSHFGVDGHVMHVRLYSQNLRLEVLIVITLWCGWACNAC